MFATGDSKRPPNLYRRSSDITPASRVVSDNQSPPTSPKIHELRERYESLQDINRDSPKTRKSTKFSASVVS